jgi:predicted secreted protein
MAVIRIDEGHNGKRVTAHVGDTIDLVLPETATTGFQWDVTEPGDPLALQTSELVPPDEGRAGAGGSRHVVVRAVRPGTGQLSLRLRRSWEPPKKGEDTYTVDVEVT